MCMSSKNLQLLPVAFQLSSSDDVISWHCFNAPYVEICMQQAGRAAKFFSCQLPSRRAKGIMTHTHTHTYTISRVCVCVSAFR